MQGGFSGAGLRDGRVEFSTLVSKAQRCCPPCPGSHSKWVAETLCLGLEPVPPSRKQPSHLSPSPDPSAAGGPFRCFPVSTMC